MLITQNKSEAIKMDVRQKRNKVLGERVVKALESRNMDAYYAETKEEAVQKALEWIPEGSTINMGGASSVHECGLIDAIKSGNYNFCDRDKAATPEEKQEIAKDFLLLQCCFTITISARLIIRHFNLHPLFPRMEILYF